MIWQFFGLAPGDGSKSGLRPDQAYFAEVRASRSTWVQVWVLSACSSEYSLYEEAMAL
jgi:hypothetical protein